METKQADQVKVSRLTIQIGSATVSLTIEQARALYDQLALLFCSQLDKKEPSVIYEWVVRLNEQVPVIEPYPPGKFIYTT